MRSSIRSSRTHADRFVLPVLLAVLLLGVLLVGTAPSFRVERIETSGTHVLVPEELVRDSGLSAGRHFLEGLGGGPAAFAGLRYADAEERLREAHPFLRSVLVRFRFPGTIRIEVEERVQVAYLVIGDSIVPIDADRCALAMMDGPPPAGIPLVEGLGVRQLRLGSPVEVDRPTALADAILLLSAVLSADADTRGDLKLLSVVRSLRPAADGILYLSLVLPDTGDDLIVRVSEPRTAGEDMEWLRYAIMQGDLNGLGSGILDLSGTQNRFVPDGK